MSFSDELKTEIKSILKESFSERDGLKVPKTDNLKLGADAVKLDATFLYADLAKSTELVEHFKWQFAAKLYKSFLYSTCKVIRSEGGHIVSFDGDRVMAVFIGKAKNTNAVRTSLKINSLKKMINKLILEKFKTDYQISHGVGIDTNVVRVVRAGIRGANDLVWISKAANNAAKLSDKRFGSFCSFITAAVYESINDNVKYSDSKLIWEKVYWNEKSCYVYSGLPHEKWTLS